MPIRKNRSKRKKTPLLHPHRLKNRLLSPNPLMKRCPIAKPPSDDSKSEGQMSVIHVTYVTIIWSDERTARIYTLLIWSYCKRNCRWKDWIQTQQLVLNTDRAYLGKISRKHKLITFSGNNTIKIYLVFGNVIATLSLFYFLKDVMPLSLRSYLFTFYILIIFKQWNLLS